MNFNITNNIAVEIKNQIGLTELENEVAINVFGAVAQAIENHNIALDAFNEAVKFANEIGLIAVGETTFAQFVKFTKDFENAGYSAEVIDVVMDNTEAMKANGIKGDRIMAVWGGLLKEGIELPLTAEEAVAVSRLADSIKNESAHYGYTVAMVAEAFEKNPTKWASLKASIADVFAVIGTAVAEGCNDAVAETLGFGIPDTLKGVQAYRKVKLVRLAIEAAKK